MGGIVLCNNPGLARTIREERFYTGAILAPNSAWLLRRSMQTFSIRMEGHRNTTGQMVEFLETLPEITKIYYPEIDGTQLTGYGGLIFFELRDDLSEYYNSFAENLKLFDTGTGMACVTSMIAQPYTGSHASLNDDEKKKMGLSKGLVRLSFGFEDIDDLKRDILNSFKSITR